MHCFGEKTENQQGQCSHWLFSQHGAENTTPHTQASLATLPLPAVRFLSRLSPLLPPRQVAATRHLLYSSTLSSCFVLLSCVPSVWGVLQLVPRFCIGDRPASSAAAQSTLTQSLGLKRWLALGGGPKVFGWLRLDGVALIVTVLGVEAFMRVWALAVFRCARVSFVTPGAGCCRSRLRDCQ